MEPRGGSEHNYSAYWGMADLDYNLNLKKVFIGEFGLASMPNIHSIMEYLPKDEKKMWPALVDGSFWHHTPVFNNKITWSNYRRDMEFLQFYSQIFMTQDTMEHFIIGTQMAQTVGIRHTIELARSRWPGECAGIVYYKLNDIYPAASWATVDWYGTPKMSHYFMQDAYAPLYACVLFKQLNFSGKQISLSVYLMDDYGVLKGTKWEINVQLYDSNLSLLKSKVYNWLNYKNKQGCLLKLPETKLLISYEGAGICFENSGNLPAVGVNLDCPEISHTFFVKTTSFG